jgi:hypothetical protein
MPPSLQLAARAFPQYWAVSGFNDIIVRGLGLRAVLPNLLVLTVIGAGSLAAGSFVYARRSRS